MSDFDALDEIAEQLDRSGRRIDGRGARHGNRGVTASRDRGRVHAMIASSVRSRNLPISLAPVNLPDLPAE